MNNLSSVEKIRYPNRWQKGVSGNYKGRPKVDPKIQALAKVHSEHAIYKLTEIMTDSNYSPQLQCFASAILLDASLGTNLLRRYLKKYRMTVWQFLNTPGMSAHITTEKATEQAHSKVSKHNTNGGSLSNLSDAPDSDTVHKILAIRNFVNESCGIKSWYQSDISQMSKDGTSRVA